MVRQGGVMVQTGWLSSYEILLNVCCVKCGTWVNEKGHDFEGKQHLCRGQPFLRKPLPIDLAGSRAPAFGQPHAGSSG